MQPVKCIYTIHLDSLDGMDTVAWCLNLDETDTVAWFLLFGNPSYVQATSGDTDGRHVSSWKTRIQ